MFDKVFDTLTSGDITRVIVFLVSFIILMGFIIGVLYFIVKKIGAKIKYNKQEGLHFDLTSGATINTPSIPAEDENLKIVEGPNIPNPIVNKQNAIGPGLNIDILEEYKQVGSVENAKSLNLQNKLSEIQWDDLKVAKLMEDLDKKEIEIKQLSKKTLQMKNIISNLNKELIKYKITNHEYLINYKMGERNYRIAFNNEIKNIILKKKPENIQENDFNHFLMINLASILELFCNKVLEDQKYDWWKSAVDLKREIYVKYDKELISEFELILRQFKEINLSSNTELQKLRSELDKRIVAAGNAFCKKVYSRTFLKAESDKEKDKVMPNNWIETISLNLSNYKQQVWDPNTFYRIISKSNIESIAIYEKIKSESIDKEMVIADQFYNLLYMYVEALIKEKLIEQAVKKQKEAAESANKKITEDLKNENELFDEKSDEELLKDIIIDGDPSDETLNKLFK